MYKMFNPKEHVENDRHVVIDFDPLSESTVCPKCCSSVTVKISLWEAAERGIKITRENKDANFYHCGDCGAIWHED